MEENYIVKADRFMKEDKIKKLEEQLTYAKFGIAMRDMTIISENAFKSQDGKKVPLVWRCDKEPFIIGTAEISSEEDGVKATCKLNGKTYEDYIYSHLKWYEKIIRKIKKWLGIVSPSEEHWPWEEQNCNLSVSFKYDNYESEEK